jgi:DNA-binding NtrC family response regulator
MQAGRFREDLFYRINVVTIRVPPLRERPEDLLPLIAHFMELHGQRLGRSDRQLSPEALALMQHYPWPGNVRELENALERALVLSRRALITPDDLPDEIHARPQPGSAADEPLSMVEIERQHILRTLAAVGGNKAAAARLLRLDRKTLYRKLQSYGVEADNGAAEGPETPRL